tara:strand:+ start:568 stop:1077 length:510 start_codon:yes stop_codon:yes gene_type:complete
MKKENINNYYTDEDLINFEKLNNYKEFKVNKLNNNQNNIHPIRYSVSDNRNFNKIMNVENNEKSSSSKEVNESKNYTSSDFENFKKLKQFTTFNNNAPLKNKTEPEKTTIDYTDKDMNAFDKIIKSKDGAKNKNDNKKIRIIDFNKLKEKEKNLKNKLGIEKIKIVYFD